MEAEEYQPTLDGYRIVNIDYFFRKTITLQTNHSRKCTAGNLVIDSEKQCGLSSTFTLKCSACDMIFTLSNEEPGAEKQVLNKAAVWGTLASGGSYSHLAELLSCLEIPTVTGNMFFDIQRNLGTVS